YLITLLLLYFGRGTVIKRIHQVRDGDDPPPVDSPRFKDMIKLLTGTTLVRGNQIEILHNGDGTYPRLWEDLRGAREVIAFHAYFMRPGRLADRLREILMERARAGVRVQLLVDAFGGWKLDHDYLRDLEAAGVKVARFRPPSFRNAYKFQQRMHVRVVNIDGRIGYSGGFGIADQWLGDGRHKGQWRETNVRMEGPNVAQLQVSFSANWAEATGTLLMGEDLFPAVSFQQHGGQEAGIMYSSPSLGSTNAERFFWLSIAAARRRLYITNAYFVPDRDFHWLLKQAAQRGVDVRVLCPGANNDRVSAYYAGRSHYEDLLRAGVRIYHYRPAMVHAKTFVADGLWAAIGSFNFDNRSMKLNNEAALVVHDRGLAEELEQIFHQDLEWAAEVTLEDLEGRPWWPDRAREQAARLVAPLL
ncbi:MAG: phospholipase D-like domain-containing protein, partial [Candidatus Competibacteraceae bacterium]|nr:phospholipase D-like domain-containing protein [Candidatus Competibacteraceae bacterium]